MWPETDKIVKFYEITAMCIMWFFFRPVHVMGMMHQFELQERLFYCKYMNSVYYELFFILEITTKSGDHMCIIDTLGTFCMTSFFLLWSDTDVKLLFLNNKSWFTVVVM